MLCFEFLVFANSSNLPSVPVFKFELLTEDVKDAVESLNVVA